MNARLITGPTILLIAAAMFVGCGSSSDDSSTEGSTSTTDVESTLQSKLADASSACNDAAASISNSTLQSAAKAACSQLDTELAKEITSASDSAKGNLSDALDNLASDCKEKVSGLKAIEGVADSFCSAIAASSDAVTPTTP